MDNDSAALFDPTGGRRSDATARFREVADLLSDGTPFDQVQAFLDGAIEAAQDAYRLLAIDRLAHAVFDIVLDVDMHDCVNGRPCHLCAIQKAQDEGRRE